jgi:hypothetical protein
LKKNIVKTSRKTGRMGGVLGHNEGVEKVTIRPMVWPAEEQMENDGIPSIVMKFNRVSFVTFKDSFPWWPS